MAWLNLLGNKNGSTSARFRKRSTLSAHFQNGPPGPLPKKYSPSPLCLPLLPPCITWVNLRDAREVLQHHYPLKVNSILMGLLLVASPGCTINPNCHLIIHISQNMKVTDLSCVMMSSWPTGLFCRHAGLFNTLGLAVIVPSIYEPCTTIFQFNKGHYPSFHDPQGFAMRTTLTPGPGGSPVIFSNPFLQQQSTPYLGNRGQTPYYDQPSRVSQRGETPFKDYPSSYSYSGSRSASTSCGSIPPPPVHGYYRGSSTSTSLDAPSWDEMATLCSEVRRLAESACNQETVNTELKKANEDLTKSLTTMLTELAHLCKQMGDISRPKPVKDGSNKHPTLKVRFYSSLKWCRISHLVISLISA